MNEVEKMMQNANLTNLYCGDDYVAERMLEFECTDNDKEKCKTCDKAKINYPPFTAEKQFELLKICFEKYERLEKVRGLKERCIIYYRFDTDGYTEFVNCETWEETIAGLINNLWQDLTEEERKQIKEILE